MAPKTILVVDDDETMRSMVSNLLENENYRILQAKDGKQGFELFRKHHPSLVISDVEMGEIDGFQLLSMIKSDVQYGLTPVILMSGAFTDLKSLRFGLGNGADDYLLKPFDSRELIESAKTRLRQYSKVEKRIQSELDHWKDNIALMLPHELNTPLTGILGCAECILDEAADRDLEDIAQLSKTIIKSSNRLGRLIKNFLFYVQLNVVENKGASPSLLNPGHEWVGHEIQSWATELAEIHIRSNDLNMRVLKNQSPLVPAVLKRIVVELLDNAFKFSEPGTPVAMTYETMDSRLCLTVTDQGTGFDPGGNRFSAFVQFNRKQQEQQGLGLGLYITQKLVESSGGKFEIKSQPGQGTTALAQWTV